MKKFLFLAVLSLCLLGLVVSCTFTGQGGKDIPVVYKDGRFVTQESSQSFKAMVKGSIYESGEQVSVFGTCLDLNDQPLAGTYALMSSWYPNGTPFFENVSMTQIKTSYFLYTGSMNAVQGTYLTEMDCYLNGSSEVARAFGEWQNPVWVARIAGLNATGQQILLQLGDLSANVNNSFAITWSKLDQINSTVLNISSQLDYVAMVANSSVDRNDSYLATLLYTILQTLNATIPPPPNQTISDVASYPMTARYNMQWGVFVQANLSGGSAATGSDANCFITTNNIPAVVNDQLDYYATVRDFNAAWPSYGTDAIDSVFSTEMAELQNTLIGGFWYHQEIVKPEPTTNFEYNVTCVTA